MKKNKENTRTEIGYSYNSRKDKVKYFYEIKKWEKISPILVTLQGILGWIINFPQLPTKLMTILICWGIFLELVAHYNARIKQNIFIGVTIISGIVSFLILFMF